MLRTRAMPRRSCGWLEASTFLGEEERARDKVPIFNIVLDSPRVTVAFGGGSSENSSSSELTASGLCSLEERPASNDFPLELLDNAVKIEPLDLMLMLIWCLYWLSQMSPSSGLEFIWVIICFPDFFNFFSSNYSIIRIFGSLEQGLLDLKIGIGHSSRKNMLCCWLIRKYFYRIWLGSGSDWGESGDAHRRNSWFISDKARDIAKVVTPDLVCKDTGLDSAGHQFEPCGRPRHARDWT